MLLIFPACTSMESSSSQSLDNRPTFSMEPKTIAQSIEEDPSIADTYSWIGNSEYDNVWIIADEFPNVKNGMRSFQIRILEAYLRTPSDVCAPLEGEPLVFRFVVNEVGTINDIKSTPDEPIECLEIIQEEVASTEFTPGKVNGKAVPTLYSAPISL